MDEIHPFPLDELPRTAAGRVNWRQLVKDHGLDAPARVYAAAIAAGDRVLATHAQMAGVREHVRAGKVAKGVSVKRGRPRKGAERRTATLSMRVTPSAKAAIEDDARDGETVPDVFHRWVDERGEA